MDERTHLGLGRRAFLAGLTATALSLATPAVAQGPRGFTQRIGQITGSVINFNRSVATGTITVDLLPTGVVRLGLADPDGNFGTVEFLCDQTFQREIAAVLASGLKLLGDWRGSSNWLIRTRSFLLMQKQTLVLQAVSSRGVFDQPFLSVMIDGSRAAPVLHLSRQRVEELRTLLTAAAAEAKRLKSRRPDFPLLRVIK
jgi:hypothetical protein